MWGLHPGNGLGGSLRRGSQEQAPASSSWPFSYPRGSHLPSALAWPLGGPASEIEGSCQQRTPPTQVCAGAVVQRTSNADAQCTYWVLGVPHPWSHFRPLFPCTCCGLLPGPRADRVPYAQWMERRGFSILSSNVAVWSMPCLFLFSPSSFPNRLKTS